MTEPTNPPVERWWSPSAGELILEHGDCYALSEPHLMIEGLPADAIRLILDDHIETDWDAATGEIEELREQLAAAAEELAENVGVMNALRRQRDTALRLKTLLWERLGRPDGAGRDIELIDAVSDMADHRTSLVAELAREKEIHAEERAAHEAWLARVTTERDDAQSIAEVFRRKLDEDTDQRDELRSQRAAALVFTAFRDVSNDKQVGGMSSDEVAHLRSLLGATDGE